MADAQPTSDTRTCKHCTASKPLADYWNPVNGRHAKWCSDCLSRRRAGTLHCRVGDCSKEVYCLGMCRGHYSQVRYLVERDRRLAREKARREANPEVSRAQSAAWRAANPERKRASDAAWAAANPERKRSNDAAYYAAKRDEIKERTAQWYRNNREEARVAQAAWNAANPDKRREYHAARRAKKSGANGVFRAAEWRAVLSEFDHACAYCQARGVALTQEHVTPLVRGGRHDRSNIVPACVSCNSRKGAKTLFEFLAAVQVMN